MPNVDLKVNRKVQMWGKESSTPINESLIPHIMFESFFQSQILEKKDMKVQQSFIHSLFNS